MLVIVGGSCGGVTVAAVYFGFFLGVLFVVVFLLLLRKGVLVMMTTLSIIGNKGLGFGMTTASIVPGVAGRGLIAAGQKLVSLSSWLANKGQERLAFAAGLEMIRKDPSLRDKVDAAVKSGQNLHDVVAALPAMVADTGKQEKTKTKTKSKPEAQKPAVKPDVISSGKSDGGPVVVNVSGDKKSDIIVDAVIVDKDITDTAGADIKDGSADKQGDQGDKGVAGVAVAADKGGNDDGVNLSFLGKASVISGISVTADDVREAAGTV